MRRDRSNGFDYVVDQRPRASDRYMIVHNIGEAPKMEDVLFNWKITGHYRYYGP
ncbi:MAG TPA: DUF1287 domain-containing protein [Terriglobales bacterium]|nr:DUF1287 domain-containing protein [Terriglobales bacterium]